MDDLSKLTHSELQERLKLEQRLHVRLAHDLDEMDREKQELQRSADRYEVEASQLRQRVEYLEGQLSNKVE